MDSKASSVSFQPHQNCSCWEERFRLWHPSSDQRCGWAQVPPLREVFGDTGDTQGLEAALSKAEEFHMQILLMQKLHAALGRCLLSFPSSQTAQIFVSSGEKVRTFSLDVFPERSWPSAASFGFSRQWGSWAPPKSSSVSVCSSVNHTHRINPPETKGVRPFPLKCLIN